MPANKDKPDVDLGPEPAPPDTETRLKRLEERAAALEDKVLHLGQQPAPDHWSNHPMMQNLLDFAGRAAASGLTLSHILEAVSVQLLGHDLRPMPPTRYAPVVATSLGPAPYLSQPAAVDPYAQERVRAANQPPTDMQAQRVWPAEPIPPVSV